MHCGNDTDTDSSLDVGRSTPILPIFLYSMVFMIGVPVNCLVLGSILWKRNLRTVSHVYVFNLALADLLHFIGYPVLLTVMGNMRWPDIFGDTVCKLYSFASASTMFASSAFLGVLSWDRYQAICHPNCTCFSRSIKKACIICGCCWVAVVLEMFPILMYSTVFHFGANSKSCILYWVPKSNMKGNGSEDIFGLLQASRKTFTFYSCFTGYLTPLAAIIIFYANILHRLWVKRAHILNRNSLKKNIRVTLICLVIVLTYTFLWLPFWVVQWSLETGAAWTKGHLLTPVSIFAYFLQGLNSAINPFLYGLLTDAFRRLFCSKKYTLRMLSRSDDPIRNTACDFSINTVRQQKQAAKQLKKQEDKRNSRLKRFKWRTWRDKPSQIDELLNADMKELAASTNGRTEAIRPKLSLLSPSLSQCLELTS